jgi:hypothetical protein
MSRLPGPADLAGLVRIINRKLGRQAARDVVTPEDHRGGPHERSSTAALPPGRSRCEGPPAVPEGPGGMGPLALIPVVRAGETGAFGLAGGDG